MKIATGNDSVWIGCAEVIHSCFFKINQNCARRCKWNQLLQFLKHSAIRSPFLFGASPNITTAPLNNLVQQGTTNVIFSCTGNPSTSIYWTFTSFQTNTNRIVDKVITFNSTVYARFTRTYAIQNGQAGQFNLVILTATSATAGTYRCISENTTKYPAYTSVDAYYYDYDTPYIIVVVVQLIVVTSGPMCSSNGSATTVGNQVQLSCSISYGGGSFQDQENAYYPTSNTINPIFSWSSGNQSLGNGSFQSIASSNLLTVSSTLIVYATNISESYQCSIAFGPPSNPELGSATNVLNYTQNCTTTVVGYPQLPGLVNMVANVGDTNVTMNCTGNTNQNIYWTFTGFKTSPASIVDDLLTTNNVVKKVGYAIQYVLPNGYNLVILQASILSAGTYRCVNELSTRRYIFYDGYYDDYNKPTELITVAQLIVINSAGLACAKNETIAQLGDAVQLNCSITYGGGSFQSQENKNYPITNIINPIFNWTSNGQSLGNGSRQPIIIVSASLVTVVSTLTVSPTNNQNYSCNIIFSSPTDPLPGVETNAPSYNQNCSIIVIVAPSGLRNTLVQVGATNVSLQCTGNISLNFYWTFSKFSTNAQQVTDTVLTSNNTVKPIHAKLYGIQTVQPNQFNLIILSATLATAGTYRCVNKQNISKYIEYDSYYFTYDTPIILIAVAQLIVINSNPTCIMNGLQLQVDGAVQLTCSISYAGGSFQYENPVIYPTSSVINPIFAWLSGGTSLGSGTSQNDPVSLNLITVVSTLTVNASNISTSYQCSTKFGSPTNPQLGVAPNAPNYNQNCSIIVVSSPLLNTVVNVGATNTTLQCMGNINMNFYWTFTPFTTNKSQVIDHLLTANNTVIMPGYAQMYGVRNPLPNQFNLVIFNAALTTAGTYRCENEPSAGSFSVDDQLYDEYNTPVIIIGVAQLIVTNSNPICQTNQSTAQAGASVQLNCSITYGGGSFQTQGSTASSNAINPIINWTSSGKSFGNGTVQTVIASNLVTVVSTFTFQANSNAAYQCGITFGPPTNPKVGTSPNPPIYNQNCSVNITISAPMG